jgi:regulator of replication initiation timing
MKTCTKWGVEKEDSGFHKNDALADGLCLHCKECRAAYKKANRVKFREYERLYAQKNKERDRERKTQWSTVYSKANKNAFKARAKKWRQENPELCAESHKLRERERRKDPLEKVKMRARMLLANAIKSGAIKKRNACEICYNSPTHCHHEDYGKPLDFVELCVRCHSKLHEQYRDQNILLNPQLP